MRIHLVGGVSYSVWYFGLVLAVGLRSDILPYQTACLTDVQLVGPVTGPDIFILGKSPAADLFLKDFGYPGICHIEIEEAEGVILVGFDNLLPLGP